ncbi:MAG: hypothetical protein JXQ87_01975 [Bacteroidia bacterium]
MNYSIDFENKVKYLHCKVIGETDSVSTSKAFWIDIKAECIKTNQRNILVEEEFNNNLRAVEAYEVAVFIAEEFKHIGKIAHFDKEASHFEMNQFGENVALNRGGQGKVFNNKKMAIDWLITAP